MSRGIHRERQIVKLENLDGWCCRSGVGGGKVDNVKVKDGEAYFIQSKSTLTPYSHFGPKDRAAFHADCDRAGVPFERRLLYWWPKNGKLRVIPSTEWPR